jgi:hypothetical protein
MGGDHLHCCYREQLGYAFYAKFREPKLFRMAVTGNWDLIPDRCRTHPKEASFVHKYPPADTALHRMLRPFAACEEQQLDGETVDKMNELKLAAVSALLDANRQAAGLPDSFGRTPLHLACMDVAGGGTTAAAMILDVQPIALTAVDSEQRTPLHFLVARNETIPVDLLSKMLEQYPEAVFRQDIVGDTPIDIVEKRKNEIHNAAHILELLKAIPDPKAERSSVSLEKVDDRVSVGYEHSE